MEKQKAETPTICVLRDRGCPRFRQDLVTHAFIKVRHAIGEGSVLIT